jgi:transcriptional regulator with XRE-family HTH domain
MQFERSDTASPLERVAGRRARRYRADLGQTLSSVAINSGLSKSFIWAFENGKRGIGLESLVCLSRALKVDPATFLDAGEEDR